MFRIRPFRSSDLPALSALSREKALSLRFNADIIKNTVLAAEDGRSLKGIGFLSASAEFQWLLRRSPAVFSSYFPAVPGPDSAETKADLYSGEAPEHFGLFAEFQGFGPLEVPVSAALLGELLLKKEQLAALCPERNLHLTVWCRESREAYLGFLREFGFRETKTLLTMKRSLFSEEAGSPAQPLPPGLFFDTPDLTDPSLMDRYIFANGLGFGIPDSRWSMLYRMRALGAQVLTVTDGSRILASLTLYPDGEGSATEDVFCVPEYRRRGLTSALLCEAFRHLKAKGFPEAHLNVYEENLPARSLYRSLGYEESDRISELWG